MSAGPFKNSLQNPQLCLLILWQIFPKSPTSSGHLSFGKIFFENPWLSDLKSLWGNHSKTQVYLSADPLEEILQNAHLFVCTSSIKYSLKIDVYWAAGSLKKMSLKSEFIFLQVLSKKTLQNQPFFCLQIFWKIFLKSPYFPDHRFFRKRSFGGNHSKTQVYLSADPMANILSKSMFICW